MAMILDGTLGATFNDGSLQGAAASPYVLKNRIINGAMVIDQRNAGASVTVTTVNYSVDRWFGEGSQSSKFTVQQNAGSITPPVGFSNYLGATSSATTSLGSTDYFILQQRIEGFNTADLGYGTANAKTVTLSFQVYSSLTGTFGGAFLNNANNRSYPFSYTISSANTWTTISITIAGDTTGTWVGATNGIGLKVIFSLGTGSTYSGTAGAWSGSLLLSATGATSVVGTSGATFYITGVQLEIGTSATPFERRLYNQELDNCKRYYQAYGNLEGTGIGQNTTAAIFYYSLSPTMRSAPTTTFTCPAVDRIGVALTSTTAAGTVFSADDTVVTYATVTMSGMGQPCSPASGALVTASAEL
jgi:hypothetical protein